MDKLEVAKLVSICSANYRNWLPEDKVDDTVNLWVLMLADLNYEVGQAAVMAHLARSPYPPTISDIRNAAIAVTEPNRLEAIEAWDLINQAIRKYGFYRAEQAMASLPPEVADMARKFTWESLCTSENEETLRAQFRMAWETQAKRTREDKQIAPVVMKMIESSGVIKRLE